MWSILFTYTVLWLTFCVILCVWLLDFSIHLFMTKQYSITAYCTSVAPAPKICTLISCHTLGNQHFIHNKAKTKRFRSVFELTGRIYYCVLKQWQKNSEEKMMDLWAQSKSLHQWVVGGLAITQATHLSVKLGAGHARGRQSRAAASAPPQSPRWHLPHCRCCPARRPRTRRTLGLALSVTPLTWCQKSERWWRQGSAVVGCSQTPHSHRDHFHPPLSQSQSHPVMGPLSACTPDTSF